MSKPKLSGCFNHILAKDSAMRARDREKNLLGLDMVDMSGCGHASTQTNNELAITIRSLASQSFCPLLALVQLLYGVVSQ